MVAYWSGISPAGVRFRAVHVHPEQIRQYFKDESFYAADVNARGLCGEQVTETNTFACEAFSPSSATVKVKTALPTRRSIRPLASSFSTITVHLGEDVRGYYSS